MGIDTTSLLSLNRNEQLKALKNTLYDGLIGFASACTTTGVFGKNAVKNTDQKQVVGAYYKKVFNNLDVDIKDVAVYLREISNGKNTNLYKSAESVLNEDISDNTVAEMMINGLERSQEAQRFVYTKIGEQLNENNRYTANGLIRQYEKLRRNGIELSQGIIDTYNELVNADGDISRGRFNYLVGKLSTTMDAVVPRASVAAEVSKKISDEIKESGLTCGDTAYNDNAIIDEDAVIAGIWDVAENTRKSEKANNVEKSRLETVENFDESGIIEKTVDNDTGVPGEYIDEIIWSIFNHLPARKCGKGYFGRRIKQSDWRVNNYELKINPNNESFYLMHPDGRYVQFENMKNSVVQDAKLVKSKRSIYYTEKLSGFMKQKLIDKANRQVETAKAAGYKLEWIVSDKTAVEQLSKFFAEQNIDVIVTYCSE